MNLEMLNFKRNGKGLKLITMIDGIISIEDEVTGEIVEHYFIEKYSMKEIERKLRGLGFLEVRRKMEVLIPLKIDSKISLNKIYAGIHWSIRKRDKDYIRVLVRNCLSLPIVTFEKPVKLTVEYNSKLDVSNHGYILKMIEDALVSNKVIINDTKKYVREITQRHQDKYEGVIINLEEIE